MKKIVKAFVLALMVMSIALPIMACGGSISAAGFALPHYDGMDATGLYDASKFYLNELRYVGADPGAIYVSPEDVEDTYNKVQALALAQDPSLTSEAWVSANGSLDDWIEEYGNAFYMIVTSSTSTISAEVKAQYATEQAAYRLYKSYDLTNWFTAGRLDGYSVNIRADGWSTEHYWAPEFIRDPETGRYFIFASAGSKRGDESTEYIPRTSYQFDHLYGIIAVSDNPLGPYELITSADYYAMRAAYDDEGNMIVRDGNVIGQDGETLTTVDESGTVLNANGNLVTAGTPPINFGLYVDQIREQYAFSRIGGIDHPSGVWPAIDFNPVIMENGDFYLYFSQHTGTLNDGNHIWGMKMKDMMTPDWSTLTHLASPNYVTVNKKDPSVSGDINNFELGERTTWAEGGINEGTEVIQHGDKYYLTYSPLGYGSRAYAVTQAVGDSPLGPFVKLGTDYNPVVGINDTNDYMAGTGHHCFIRAGEELYILYHAFYNPIENSPNGEFLGRAVGVDKVVFKENDSLGYEILYGNGPTYSLQPLPSVVTGMTNIAKTAKITVDGNADTAHYLVDDMFTVQNFTSGFEYVAPNTKNQGTVITLTWDKPVEVSALVVYNAQNFFFAFDKVDLINFKLAEKPDWYNLDAYNGYCYIENLLCNPENLDEGDMFMRQGGGALASFRNIKVTEMQIKISSKYTTDSEDFERIDNYEIHVSELYVMGREV